MSFVTRDLFIFFHLLSISAVDSTFVFSVVELKLLTRMLRAANFPPTVASQMSANSGFLRLSYLNFVREQLFLLHCFISFC